MKPACTINEVEVTRTLFARYHTIVAALGASSRDDRVSNANLLWMCNTCITRDLPLGKMSRWLGFVQGVLAARGLIDVDEERALSRPLFHQVYGEYEILERPIDDA